MTPEDRDFLERFENCTLPESQFGHAGHVRMAWLQLGQYPFDVALDRISNGIRRYARAQGATSKYHETVTVAFARIIASRMRHEESFAVFAERNADLLSPEPLLARFYSASLLDSDAARSDFVEPDLEPLPEPDER